MAHAIEYRRLRAPREHGQALIDPPLSEVARLIDQNQETSDREFAGVYLGEHSLADLRTRARKYLFEDAWTFSSVGGRAPAIALHPVPEVFVLSGHQPELYHPGVWFKNFVLSEIGERHQAAPINLIINNDVVGAPAIRVPRSDGTIDLVALVNAKAHMPYEERWLDAHDAFSSFAQRVGSDGRLLVDLWQHIGSAGRLDAVVASARHRLEQSYGLKTLEAPLSNACDSEMFWRFAFHLLTQIDRLHSVYNDAAGEYRRVHRIRSRSHPVPDLQVKDDWLEAPFWIWSESSPARQPVFVKLTPEQLVVRGSSAEISIPLNQGRVTDRSLETMFELRLAGLKLRPRALITTMYARLVLSDLFLHGIGGAKYDQVTDAIIARFFGLTPPRYMTVTATLKLFPEYQPAVVQEELQRVEHALRELPYHPESFAAGHAGDGEFQRLCAEKRQLVQSPPPKGHRQAWHEAITALNAQLRSFADERESQLRLERERLQQQLHEHALLGSRELSFCLFDERLPDQLKQLARGVH